MKLQFAIFIIFHFKFHECSISKSKCQEYGKAVFVQNDSPVLMRIAKKDNVSECAIVSIPLIVGGTKVTEKEFPHMAVIGFGQSPDSVSWECGGSLISDLYVLTAAHCLESREMGPAQKVKFGTIQLDITDPYAEERNIIERIPHSDYKPPRKANDIALVKMNEKIDFTPYIRPACLNVDNIEDRRKAIAIGFGKLSHNDVGGSKDLMKVTLETYSNEQCSRTLPTKESIVDSMICAGQLAGGKDTCQGDSGGPLQIVLEDPYCMYSIIGITSFGKFCGFANSPAIYSKVASFVPWIESIVWK